MKILKRFCALQITPNTFCHICEQKIVTSSVIDLFPAFKSFISKLSWVVFTSFVSQLEIGMICYVCLNRFLHANLFCKYTLVFHGRTKKGWSIETIIVLLNSWNVATFFCKKINKTKLYCLLQYLLSEWLFMSLTQGGMFCVKRISFHCLFCAKFLTFLFKKLL